MMEICFFISDPVLKYFWRIPIIPLQSNPSEHILKHRFWIFLSVNIFQTPWKFFKKFATSVFSNGTIVALLIGIAIENLWGFAKKNHIYRRKTVL